MGEAEIEREQEIFFGSFDTFVDRLYACVHTHTLLIIVPWLGVYLTMTIGR